MSSRALRRLQREEEERKQLALLEREKEEKEEEEKEESEDDDLDSIQPSVPKSQKNAFDFLNAANEDDEDEEEAEPSDQTSVSDEEKSTHAIETTNTTSKRKKKAKKKKKKTPAADKAEKASSHGSQLDEIDLALKSLRTDIKGKSQEEDTTSRDASLNAFYDLISTDSKHLNALNEMKKLFGSTVLEGERDTGGAGRRRARGPVQLDLGGALAGRNSPISRGQGLVGLALRRNVFMLGKEEWPKATSGGLGMDLVEKAWDLTTEYRFVHSTMYQGVQRQFQTCVESMDPQRMISLLQKNPYHISTLLQVSEIAKHQGDHSVSVDLLERALFTFGRSVHSSFHTALSQGKARLDFRRPENREFWLTAFRCIGSLGQRGTWRTAFEWAKLLLSLDPEGDPYAMRLIIDQLAFRGGQFEHLVKLAATEPSIINWGQGFPNIQISAALAYYKLKQSEQAFSGLWKAAKKWPWMFTTLCKELDLEPVPKSVWGIQPKTPQEELLAGVYAVRAKDIWNTPEALSFLKEGLNFTGQPVKYVQDTSLEPSETEMINEARHILNSDIPSLISLIPRWVTEQAGSSSDPLPPSDDVLSYTLSEEAEREEWEEEIVANERESRSIHSWFSSIVSRLGLNVNFLVGNSNDSGEGLDDFPVDQVAEALVNEGVDINEFAQRTRRLQELRQRQVEAEQRLRELETGLNNIDGRLQALDDDAALAAALARSVEDPFPPTQPPAALPPTSEPETSASVPAPAEPSAIDSPSETASTSRREPYDDAANQRWLAGRGMLALKDFVAAHGADENSWKDDLDVDVTPATEYAHRITQLSTRQAREFILNYSLKQGAGAEASQLIRRLAGL